jgi:hypothetical protein
MGLRSCRRSRSKQFFFEKKNQKTFALMAFVVTPRAPQWPKVFASFFKKKRVLP